MQPTTSKNLVHICGVESQQGFHVSNTAMPALFTWASAKLAALLAKNGSRLEAADPVQLSGFTELCMLGPPCSGPSTPTNRAAKERFGRPIEEPQPAYGRELRPRPFKDFRPLQTYFLLHSYSIHSIISVWVSPRINWHENDWFVLTLFLMHAWGLQATNKFGSAIFSYLYIW